MGSVTRLPKTGKFDVEYGFGDDGKIVAVTHPQWPFRIMRNGERIALVCEDGDEPFGELDADVFNTIVMCWLLVDDPELITQAAGPRSD
jgi:hypothetical protein